MTGERQGTPPLIPRPKSFETRGGLFDVIPPLPFFLAPNAGLSVGDVRLALGPSLALAKTSDRRPVERGLQMMIGNLAAEVQSPEAYELEVTRGKITIIGQSGQGIVAGLRTLRQLALQSTITQCRIADWPDMSLRAAHLCYHLVRETTAYNCPNFEALLLQVDRLAALKYNGVLLELESLFPFENHPLVSCKIAFSPAQVAQLRDRLKAHHMEVIPIVQSLGHAYNVLVHEEYSSYGEVPGTIQQYCPTNDAVADLYMEFVDEYLKLFPDIRQWHMGGDEARQLGLCDSCRRKVDDDGVSKLYIDHVKRIAARLRERKITPLIWSDMLEHHPEAAGDLPRFVKIVYWNYDLPNWGRKYAVPMFVEKKFSVIGSPGVRFGSSGTELSVYYKDALRGIETLLPKLAEDKCSEVMVTNWMKGSPHEQTHYGFAYAADLCWTTTRNRARSDFRQRYAAVNFGMQAPEFCEVYEKLSVKVPYAEPVQAHMPDRLDRFNLSGLRFPEKWRLYSRPGREKEVIGELEAAYNSALDAERMLHDVSGKVVRDRRQFDLLMMSAESIRIKARFGLALHAGNHLDITSASTEAITRWRQDVPGVLADWKAAKKKHLELLTSSGFAPAVNFLNDLIFEPMEYEFLVAINERLGWKLQEL